MQLVLVAVVGYGLVARQPKAVTNGTIALLVTLVPAIMERDYELPLDPWLTLWITTAVFLHTLGSAGLYGRVGWWDHLTHATSATLVAAVGYTVVRAIDLHHPEIRLPHRFAFVVIVVVVMAFGVAWELFEFGLDRTADATGMTMPLAQVDLDDTVRDMIFNTAGALFVATFGQAHLTGLADQVRDRLLAARDGDG